MWQMTLRTSWTGIDEFSSDVRNWIFQTIWSTMFVRHYWRDNDKSETVCRNSWRFTELRIKLIFSNKSVWFVREREVILFAEIPFSELFSSESYFFVKLKFVKTGNFRDLWKSVGNKIFSNTKPWICIIQGN